MDPGHLETEALGMALSQHDQPEARMGLVPWVLIVDFAIRLLLKRFFLETNKRLWKVLGTR